MKIAYISTYTPRPCGIATFTNELVRAINRNERQMSVEQHIFAVTNGADAYVYPNEVVREIEKEQLTDYIDAANVINNGGYDICVLEHEYGIYGGNSGGYVLSILKRLRMPVVVNLHTILENPSVDEKAILLEIAQQADKLVVMTSYATDLLTRVYHISRSKIIVIPHGVPAFPLRRAEAKEVLGLTNRRVMLTFGLMGRNKGIDVVIKALPTLVKKFPDLIYLVVGKTHPEVLRHAGEEYRHYLEGLVHELDLSHHVVFHNSFVGQDQLATYLSACDIYLTPYLNEAQVTSGTLSYALGAGACVVSTPYWHAAEVLADGRGILFPFKDHQALETELHHLLVDDSRLDAIRNRVRHLQGELSWGSAALRYLDVFLQTQQEHGFIKADGEDVSQAAVHLDFQHIRRLTNQVGIIQHATYATPNYHHGYCLDDNARALLLALMAQENNRQDDRLNELISTYIAYIYYAQRPEGNFRNFMGFDNRFLEEIGSEDAFGRCVWALGYLVRCQTNSSFHQIGKEMFDRAKAHFLDMRSLRAVAYNMLGIVHYLEYEPQNQELIGILHELVDFMYLEYQQNSTEHWHWFEKVVSYDNAIIPLALLRAHRYVQREDVLQVARLSAAFLDAILFRTETLSLIGNEGWYTWQASVASFGQQPIEVYSTMLLYTELHCHDPKPIYHERMKRAYNWFLGENDLQLKMYDEETGGCCDGLEAYGVNRNQGAESTITFWLSTLHMQRVFGHYPYYPLASSSWSKSSKFTVA
ncbi:glycosyltransferase family 4 protein [Sphingobacterium suaedae]|uniref:Glycosyltransferase family 4 protein n=1 Tax=Sphingobacterium suaedae TaxID=1686402 RepID=A0ABW5KET0_9SPHI